MMETRSAVLAVTPPATGGTGGRAQTLEAFCWPDLGTHSTGAPVAWQHCETPAVQNPRRGMHLAGTRGGGRGVGPRAWCGQASAAHAGPRKRQLPAVLLRCRLPAKVGMTLTAGRACSHRSLRCCSGRRSGRTARQHRWEGERAQDLRPCPPGLVPCAQPCRAAAHRLLSLAQLPALSPSPARWHCC